MAKKHGSDKPDFGTDTLEKEQVKIKEPSMYKVVLINDDYTTRDFVVEVLVEVFGCDATTATRIMLDVHRKGRGVVSTFTYDIAVSKAGQVHHRARAEGFPLQCQVEPA